MLAFISSTTTVARKFSSHNYTPIKCRFYGNDIMHAIKLYQTSLPTVCGGGGLMHTSCEP